MAKLELGTFLFRYCNSESVVSILVIFVLAPLLLQLLRTYWRLQHIPGPLLASITNLQRVYWVKTNRAHEIHQELHENYGDVVRFGPNMVSLRDPALIPSLYPVRPGFPKVCSLPVSHVDQLN
jgi:hypothetical protein